MFQETITDSSVKVQLEELRNEVTQLRKKVDDNVQNDDVNIICFSGDWDRLYAALTIASGALALGKNVHLFFTFWAVSALERGDQVASPDKTILQKMFSWMLPCGPLKAPLSKMNMLGLGKMCVKQVMKQTGIEDIDVLYRDVVDLGAEIHVCETSTLLFGIKCEELADHENIDRCGVTTFMTNALKSKMTLFI
jgi:peroxiredoxin family protein